MCVRLTVSSSPLCSILAPLLLRCFLFLCKQLLQLPLSNCGVQLWLVALFSVSNSRVNIYASFKLLKFFWRSKRRPVETHFHTPFFGSFENLEISSLQVSSRQMLLKEKKNRLPGSLRLSCRCLAHTPGCCACGVAPGFNSICRGIVGLSPEVLCSFCHYVGNIQRQSL